MSKRKRIPKKIYRAEKLACPLNKIKALEVKSFLARWLQAVKVESKAGWKTWTKTGVWRSNAITAESPPLACHAILGTSFGQMCFAQTNAAYAGYFTSVAERIKRIINASRIYPELTRILAKEKAFHSMLKSLSMEERKAFDKEKQDVEKEKALWLAKEKDTKHQLSSLNVQHAWIRPLTDDLEYGDKNHKQKIETFSRLLIKRMYKYAMRVMKQPDFSKNLWPKIDQRKVRIEPSKTSKHFELWIRLSTLERGRLINLPLSVHSRFLSQIEKAGSEQLATTVQLQPPKAWRTIKLEKFCQSFGVTFFIDFKPAFATTKEAYQSSLEEKREVAIDKGMCVLFATDTGDLLGRDWKGPLIAIDNLLTKLTAYRQKTLGKEYAYSKRQHQLVARARGYLETEINRIFNRLIETHHPAKLIFEDANFFEIGSGRQMNRLLRNMGEGIIKEKLKSLEQEFGIETEYRVAAYTSQECIKCHYVDKRNRPEQKVFCCQQCGYKCHADVGASRVLRFRRSESTGISTRVLRQALLLERVTAYQERNPWPMVKVRASGLSCDPRFTNPYFTDVVNDWLERGVILTNNSEKKSYYVAQQYRSPTLKSS